MMKHAALFSLCMLFAVNALKAQNFEQLLAQGKSEFKSRQFADAVTTLEKAVKLNPMNSEAHYFLGYSYDRLNSADADGIPNLSIDLTTKASKEFETVNQLTPKYTGEFVILDPYSKITAEWGSAAFKYLYHNKKDSAIWALKQGKAKGGFSEFFMQFNRMNLEQCSKNAFLFLSGDNFTFYNLYLQLIEQCRTDVKAIDVGMLGSKWYPALLRQHFNVQFDRNDQEVDSIQRLAWSDSLITIGNFTWTVQPTLAGSYLDRKDVLFLSLLNKNGMIDQANFIGGYPDDDKLFLTELCLPYLDHDRVTVNPIETNWDTILKDYKNFLYLSEYVNQNSKMEVLNFESIQIRTMYFVYLEHYNGDENNARKLMSMFNKHFKHYGHSFTNEDVHKFYMEVNALFTQNTKR